MANINCGNCDIEFTTHKESKILHCGHSFCTDCIFRLNKCPLCNHICNDEELLNPPTNHSLEKALRILETKLNISEFLSRFDDTKMLISNLLGKLMFNSPFLKHYRNINFDNLGMHEKLEMINNPFNSVKLGTKDNVQICLQLKDFKDREDFIPTIIAFLKQDYKFYASHQVRKDIFYGKLCLREGWTDELFVHSLNESDLEKQANIILFNELKGCTGYYLVRTFVEIPPLLMVFTMEDINVTTQFISKCTGESGASYKGLFYHTMKFGNDDEIGTVMVDGCRNKGRGFTDKPLEYNLGLHVEAKPFQKCFVLQKLSSGGFKVLKCGENSENIENVIGILHERCCLENQPILGLKSKQKYVRSFITDTGIALSQKYSN